jgi:hypothetical protein
MSKEIQLFKKEYSDESLLDLEEDVCYTIENSGIEPDEHGFRPGTFIVTIEWIPDE